MSGAGSDVVLVPVVRKENIAKRIAESHHSDRERYLGKAKNIEWQGESDVELAKEYS